VQAEKRNEPDRAPEVLQVEIDARRIVEREFVFSGTVIDSEGQPIEGATVSWTPLGDEVMEPNSTFLSLADFVSENTLLVSSDKNGAFGFEKSPAIRTENGSVIWMTHTSYGPRYEHLDSIEESWTRGKAYEMSPAEPEVAKVVDSEGHGVAGAKVLQAAHSHPDIDEANEVLVRSVYRVLPASVPD